MHPLNKLAEEKRALAIMCTATSVPCRRLCLRRLARTRGLGADSDTQH